MHIALDTRSKGKQKKSKLQARFDKLRQQLEKQERRNDKLALELDELVKRFHAELSSVEREQLAARVRLAEKLIVFFTRKSLSDWHRDELAEWIGETIDRIGLVDAEASERLRGSYHEAVAGVLGVTPAELDEQARTFAEELGAAFEAALDDDDEPDDGFDDDGQQDLFDDDELWGEAADGPWHSDEAFFDDGFVEEHTPRQAGLMDGTWIRGLFHRAAKALHPDRERDPEQRRIKENLMQRLLQARKEGDVMTLLQLYGDNAVKGEVVLAKEEMQSACELMEARLATLRQQQEELGNQDPIRSFVYNELYSPTRKTRERKLRAWRRQMEDEAEETARLLGELRNLKVLKAVLGERREQRFVRELGELMDSQMFR